MESEDIPHSFYIVNRKDKSDGLNIKPQIDFGNLF